MNLPRWLSGPRDPRDRHHAFDPTMQVLRDAAVDAQRSRLPQMAAALSYRTIFGLLPVLAIGLVALHKFATDPQDLGRIVRAAIDFFGLSNIVVDQSVAAAPPAAGADTAFSWFVGPPAPPGVPTAGPAMGEPLSLNQWITDLVARINSINFRAIGAIGVVMLLYAAISMIVEIERAFNQIFRVPRGRSWTRRLTNYTTLLVYAPIGLFLTFYIGQSLSGWVQQLSGGFGSGAMSIIVAGYAAQVLITAAMLLVVYQVVPNTKVHFMPALAGALLAAMLFEAGKFGFGQYVEFSASRSYARLYGSLALIPLFLLWVYFTWLIVLFGLQITYELQHGRSKTRAQPIFDFGPTVVDPAAGLVVMTSIARSFVAGEPQSVQSLVRATSLPEPAVSLVISRLAERGLLHRLERDDQASEPVYSLARAPGSIRIGEILSIGFEIAGSPDASPVLDRMRQAQIQAAGSETLADAARLDEVSISPAQGDISLTPSGRTPTNPTPTPSPRRGATPLGPLPSPAPPLPPQSSPAAPAKGQGSGQPATLP